jgi:uncharacterized protein
MLKELEILRQEKQLLSEKFGVEELGIFGSVARGENKPDSDIDILASFNINTLHNYIALVEYLQSRLNRKVDLVTKHKFLSARFVEEIKRDIVYV